MADFTTYWFLLPLGIIISTIYSSTGISGSNFWAPVYLLWLKLDSLVGFWLALLSMLFGSLGGMIGHIRHKTINWKLVIGYLPITIPAAIGGAILTSYIPGQILMIVFGTFVILYALHMLYHLIKRTKHKAHRKVHFFQGVLGGFLTGLVASGLGKLILPKLITHEDVHHHSQAVGSTLMIVFITSFVALLFRLNPLFLSWLRVYSYDVIVIMIYVAPGVLIGGQIGPKLAKRLNQRHMLFYVSGLLLVIGALMFIRVF